MCSSYQYGMSALMYAKKHGHEKIVRLLTSAKVHILEKVSNRDTSKGVLTTLIHVVSSICSGIRCMLIASPNYMYST